MSMKGVLNCSMYGMICPTLKDALSRCKKTALAWVQRQNLPLQVNKLLNLHYSTEVDFLYGIHFYKIGSFKTSYYLSIFLTFKLILIM